MTVNGDVTADTEARIEVLLQTMTTEEKAALLAGANMWETVPIERLGIPAMKVSDGPNGARGGGGFVGGAVTSACFPVGISLASTWNTTLLEQVGKALAEEVKSKGAHMLLAPTVNIHRSPLNGRNFECYSEDPYLSARMAVAYITGLQRERIGATVKHYVCNDSEFERNSISSEVDERTMREIYLPPFQAAVQEAGSWAVMSSYNRVNGTYTGEHPELLRSILKEEWGFSGIVMSDWFGTKSTAGAVNGGMDLEMPGPAQWRGARLLTAIEAGDIHPEALDDAARRMLRALLRVGAFEHPELPPEESRDLPEHRALIRRTAAEGMVLLKNAEGLLPLDPKRLESIAIIGPNARTAQIMGGGSAQVNAHYAVTPYDGIVAAVGDQTELRYTLGCTNHKRLPRLEVEHPFAVAYFNNQDLDGEPVYQSSTTSAEQMWMDNVAPGVQRDAFSVRLSTHFTASETGTYTFGLSSAGLTRLFVDGQQVIDNWSQQTRGDTYFGMGSTEVEARVAMIAGQTYDLRIEYSNRSAMMLSGFRLGALPPVPDDAIAHAVELAAQSDVAVVFVGLNGDWECEGFDRPDMELVGAQNELVARVAAANPRTVVVLQTGSPVTLPWLNEVAALVQAWYPGQECGNAIADVLFGKITPSGKLPQTFPRRLQDNPAYINYPGENGRVRYGEGIFVGYRYYEKKDVAPLFPFGFGLSYTRFSYANLRLSAPAIAPDDTLFVQVDVTNAGQYAGQEIVQLYVHDVQASVARPHKELKGFAKVALAPGETATVTIALDRTALAYWDDMRHAWVAEAGEFVVLVGASSQDIRGQASFHLSETATFGGPHKARVKLSVESTVRDLLEDERAAAVLDTYLPGFSTNPQLGMARGMTLLQLASFMPHQLTEATLQAIAAELAAISS